eukprot:6931210-Pyramimonas_sp.AAC.1
MLNGEEIAKVHKAFDAIGPTHTPSSWSWFFNGEEAVLTVWETTRAMAREAMESQVDASLQDLVRTPAVGSEDRADV